MKINDTAFFFSSFIYIIPILISDNIYFDIILLLLSIIDTIIIKRFRSKTLIYFVIIMLLPLISVFITTILYAKNINNSQTVYLLGKIKTSQYALHLSYFLIVRTFSLSFISFSFLVGLDYDKLIISLMQNLKLPVSVGYSLLATFNAFFHLKDEYFRIKNAYMMRFGKKRSSLLLFFPMIISAARYAYYAGLSLESRGLNKDKTYLEKIYWIKKDTFYILFNIIFVAIIIAYFVIKGSFGFKFK